MANIPTYDSSQVQTSPASRPQAQAAGADVFGAEVGKALGMAGQALQQYSQVQDHQAVLGARNELNTRLNQLARDTDIDPETNQPLGYLNRQGPAAKGVGREFEADLQENIDDIKSTLTNDTQKKAFEILAAKHIQAYTTAIHEHEYKQSLAVAEQTATDAVNQTFDLIAQNYNSPELTSAHIDDGITAIRSFMATKGYSDPMDPATVAKVQAYESTAHKLVVESYIKTGQVSMAKAYFDAFNSAEPERDAEGKPVPGTEGSVFTSADALHLEGVLKPLSDHQEAFDIAHSVYSDTKPLSMMEKEVMEQTGRDGQKTDLAMAEIHKLRGYKDADQAAAAKESGRKIYGNIAQLIMQGKNPTLADIPSGDLADLIASDGHAAETLVRDLQTYAKTQVAKTAADKIISQLATIELQGKTPKVGDIPKADWDALKTADPHKAMELAEHIKSGQEHMADRARELANRPTNDQVKTYVDLITNPKALQAANLNQMFTRGLITRDQVSHLATVQGSMEKKNEKDPIIENNKAMVDHVLGVNGITAKKDEGTYNQMYMDLYDWARGQKEPPTQGQYAEKAKQLIETKVVKDGFLWNSDKPLVSVETKDIVVPAKEKDLIVKALQGQGIKSPSDIQVKTIYRRSLVRGAQ